jgi:KaiC/GvpD/RAD55 family RecA-like ATPase
MTSYDLTETIPIDELESVPAGSSYLVVAPKNDLTEDVTIDLLAAGARQGEATLAITTEKAGGAIESAIRGRGGGDTDDIVVVDAQAGTREIDPTGQATQQRIASPQNLTDIGLCLTNVTRRFREAGIERARIGMLSLTELFSYTGTETVFKFCNTATGRIGTDGQIGFFTINSNVQDETGLATIRRVFDGTIELRESDDGRQARLQTPESERDWVDV